MQFDKILVHMGAFGKYQKALCVLLSLVSMPCAWHMIGPVFLAAETDHWCAPPADQSLNCTDGETDPESTAACLELQKNQTIPFTIDKQGNGAYSKCERYVTAWSEDLDEFGSNATFSNETTTCDAGWQYDRSQYHTTVIQEFDLVCSKEDFPGFAQSVFFAGVLTGSFVWTAVADWSGRRLVFYTSLCMAVVFSTVTVFVHSFAAYTALRFFIAMNFSGQYLSSYVIVTEIVGPAYRTMIGTIFSCFFSIGYVTLAVLAYLIREWRYLQLALSLPLLLFFSFLLFLPESPRWLISKKKYEQAEKVIVRMTKTNGTQAPENMFDELDELDELQEKRTSVLSRHPNHIDLFRTPGMRKKTLNIFYNWSVISLVYYGLSFSTSALGVNDYVAAFVSGAIELPGYLSSWFAIQKWGRRLPLCLYLVIGGLASLITIFISPGILRAAVAMVGKFVISGSFNIIYVYSIELFPTPVRSIGLGTSSMVARISGVLVPIILLLAKYWEPIPLIVFGGSSLLAGILTLFLPETLNQALPETIQDGEEIGQGQAFGLKTLFNAPSRPTNSDTDAANDKHYDHLPTHQEMEKIHETTLM